MTNNPRPSFDVRGLFVIKKKINNAILCAKNVKY
jgi:hypothetical protein